MTALDTNVLSALWSNEDSARACARALDDAAEEGGLVICGVVYAELLAHPQITQKKLDAFLIESGIAIDFDMDEDLWRKIANAYVGYCRRRQRAKGGSPRRLLADFVVGGHAIQRADALLTLDPDLYRLDFPKLRLLKIEG